jgi:phosphatidylglycerol lysyltransferase
VISSKIVPGAFAPANSARSFLQGRFELTQLAPETPSARSAPAESTELLEDLAFRYGRSYESYLVTEAERECFWLRERPGVVAYLRRDKYLHVGGGLLAADEDKPLLLTSFVDWARGEGLSILFYNIAPDELSLFVEAGFQATKWGEEPLIDLAQMTWKGRTFEWVRRQNSYALRNGLEFSECLPELLADDAWDRVASEVESIATATLAERPQVGDIGFLNGRFDAANLGRRRLFLARNTQLDRIDGFLLCNPCRGGAEWALELYCDRADAIRGTIPFLMFQALQQFQREGVERASLCLIAGTRCDQSQPGDSPLIRRALSVSGYFNFIFDVSGMYHYKSRFRPRFEDRFICANPAVTLGAARSFVRVCGALRLDPVKLARRLWRNLTHARARATLATPTKGE